MFFFPPAAGARTHLASLLNRLIAVFTLQAARALAAEGGERVVLVADSRRFSGWEAWWANLYNESRLAMALLTILIVPLLGLLISKATDAVMKRLGINLRTRVVSER